jgi:hypothetical protein
LYSGYFGPETAHGLEFEDCGFGLLAHFVLGYFGPETAHGLEFEGPGTFPEREGLGRCAG